MTSPITQTPITLDATGMAPGRLATTISRFLQGKHTASYSPRVAGTERIVVTNAAQMKLTGRKETTKVYYRHSGHPGGLSEESLGTLMQRDPAEVLRRAVLRMLPKNRLRDERMKRLKIS